MICYNQNIFAIAKIFFSLKIFWSYKNELLYELIDKNYCKKQKTNGGGKEKAAE